MMKKVISILIAVLMLVTFAFATEGSKSLDDIINEESSSGASESTNQSEVNSGSSSKEDTKINWTKLRNSILFGSTGKLLPSSSTSSLISVGTTISHKKSRTILKIIKSKSAS